MAVLIVLCLLLLLAYLFDLFSDRLNIPSVLILMLLGFGLRQTLDLLRVGFPDLFVLLPALGQVGLVLIVLEGALELDLGKENIRLARTSFLSALAGVVSITAILAFLFSLAGGSGFKSGLLHAIAFSAVSSAVAIAGAKCLKGRSREYVIYESSFSDILAVLFFNFVAFNNLIGWDSFLIFLAQIVLMAVISFAAIYLLFLLLNRIAHPVKFVPMILLVVLIYSVSKELHLPGLIFILLFGLFLNNFEHFGPWPFLRSLSRENNEPEVKRFTNIVIEITFLFRSIFFLIFGFSLTAGELLDAKSLLWAVLIAGLVFALRLLQMKAFGIHDDKVLYFAPRGLITILLYLSIAPEWKIPTVGRPMVFQVIFLTSLVLLFGILKKPQAVIPRS